MATKPTRPTITCRSRIETIEKLKETAAGYSTKCATVHSLALEFVMWEQNEEFTSYLEKNRIRLNPYDYD